MQNILLIESEYCLQPRLNLAQINEVDDDRSNGSKTSDIVSPSDKFDTKEKRQEIIDLYNIITKYDTLERFYNKNYNNDEDINQNQINYHNNIQKFHISLNDKFTDDYQYKTKTSQNIVELFNSFDSGALLLETSRNTLRDVIESFTTNKESLQKQWQR